MGGRGGGRNEESHLGQIVVIEEASNSFPVLDEASEVHAANEPER